MQAHRVEILAAEPQSVDVPRDGDNVQRIFRCPRCRVAVFSEYGQPEVWFVRGGTLDDPTHVKPDVHVYTRSKVDWVTLQAGTPAFKVYYDPAQLWPADSIRLLDAISRRPDPEADGGAVHR
jgi:hypothetical protein